MNKLDVIIKLLTTFLLVLVVVALFQINSTLQNLVELFGAFLNTYSR